jgi:hypothetical protein
MQQLRHGIPPNHQLPQLQLQAHLSRHCAGVRPTMGAMVRHCVGMSLARCSSFSSSSRVHSVFLMLGSSHSYLHGSDQVCVKMHSQQLTVIAVYADKRVYTPLEQGCRVG